MINPRSGMVGPRSGRRTQLEQQNGNDYIEFSCVLAGSLEHVFYINFALTYPIQKTFNTYWPVWWRAIRPKIKIPVPSIIFFKPHPYYIFYLTVYFSKRQICCVFLIKLTHLLRPHQPDVNGDFKLINWRISGQFDFKCLGGAGTYLKKY